MSWRHGSSHPPPTAPTDGETWLLTRGCSAYLGFDNGGIPSTPRDCEYEVTFNDVVIVPRRPQCAQGCTIPTVNNNVQAGFDLVTGTLPPQAQSVTGLLKIHLHHPVYDGIIYQASILDVITLKVAA